MSTEHTLANLRGTIAADVMLDERSERFDLLYDESEGSTVLARNLTADDLVTLSRRLLQIASYYDAEMSEEERVTAIRTNYKDYVLYKT